MRAADVDAESSDREVGREIRRKTRRSFLVGGVAALAGIGGWRWLGSRRSEDGIPWPLRRAHEVNEQIGRDYFASTRLAPSFPRELARMPRVNGQIGMEGEGFDPAAWRLRVEGLADETLDALRAARALTDERGPEAEAADEELGEGVALFTLDQIKALPRTEIVTQLKCIEGWSEVVHWGARASRTSPRGINPRPARATSRTCARGRKTLSAT